MRRRATAFLLAAALLLGAAAAARAAAPYDLFGSDFSGGGGRSAGGAYTLDGDIGQPAAGVLTNGSYELTGGFLAGQATISYRNYMPVITK